MPTKIPVTGGPGTGKTTTLNILAEEHTIVREVARDLIDTQLKVEGGILPWTDLMTFQHMVHAVQKQRERGLTPGYVYLDRSHIDQLAYVDVFHTRHDEDEFLSYTRLLVESANYAPFAFILDPIPDEIMEADPNYRKEDPETSRIIHEALKKVYIEFGMELLAVPYMSVKDRVEFIEAETKKRVPR
ncbi:MAG: AAA family ATPase [Pseudomonadota bacterium]|jgi:predicted ATPase